MKFIGRAGEYFELCNSENIEYDLISNYKESELLVVWFLSDDNELIIDAVEYQFNKNAILCLTEFNKVIVKKLGKVKILKWNKFFYCILNHDSEVGCKGVLFYGGSILPVIYPNVEEINTLSQEWNLLENEMTSTDNFQQEMLQMMLKRILIICTRVYKKQVNSMKLDNSNMDLIREYNFLVEQHFKEKHTVAEYAELLYKSPKTLSNLFKKIGNKSPLQFIHDRKLLEAKRLLYYSDKTVSEVGYELGFSDIQSFSRFFKKNQGVTPLEFKS